MPVLVRKWYAPDLPFQPILWPSWTWWRWAQMHPDDPSIEYRDYVERPWGEGMTAWDKVDWPVSG